MTIRDNATQTALAAASCLRSEARKTVLASASTEAEDASRWLESIADMIVSAAGHPELVRKLREGEGARVTDVKVTAAPEPPTPSVKKLHLTIQQTKFLIDIDEPMDQFQEFWWFDLSAKQRSGDALVKLGLAVSELGFKSRKGYRLTPAGEALARDLREAGGSKNES